MEIINNEPSRHLTCVKTSNLRAILGVRNQLSAETSDGYPSLCVSDPIIVYLWDELADCEAEKRHHNWGWKKKTPKVCERSAHQIWLW